MSNRLHWFKKQEYRLPGYWHRQWRAVEDPETCIVKQIVFLRPHRFEYEVMLHGHLVMAGEQVLRFADITQAKRYVESVYAREASSRE